MLLIFMLRGVSYVLIGENICECFIVVLRPQLIVVKSIVDGDHVDVTIQREFAAGALLD
jgi:hypothetical protein